MRVVRGLGQCGKDASGAFNGEVGHGAVVPKSDTDRVPRIGALEGQVTGAPTQSPVAFTGGRGSLSAGAMSGPPATYVIVTAALGAAVIMIAMN